MKYSDIKGLSWRERNAVIEVAVRTSLGSQPKGLTFESFRLAELIDPDGSREDHGALSKIMVRMAPFLTGLATHDGEQITRYQKTWRRWRWHGQALPVEAPTVGSQPAGAVCVFCQKLLTTAQEKAHHYHFECRAEDIRNGEHFTKGED